MDIALERILTLIPKKEDGSFKHGALKQFANSIGLKSGNLISDWINLRSGSYSNYLYEIAAKYNVSVEWLRGETDDPTPIPPESIKKEPTLDEDELSPAMLDLMEAARDADDELLAAVTKLLRTAKKTGGKL